MSEKQGGRPAEVVESELGGLASPPSSIEIPGLNQIGFVDVFERTPIFLNGRSQ